MCNVKKTDGGLSESTCKWFSFVGKAANLGSPEWEPCEIPKLALVYFVQGTPQNVLPWKFCATSLAETHLIPYVCIPGQPHVYIKAGINCRYVEKLDNTSGTSTKYQHMGILCKNPEAHLAFKQYCRGSFKVERQLFLLSREAFERPPTH